MHPNNTLRNLFILSIISAGLFAACTRIGVTNIGGDLIPSIDGIVTMDTLLDVITDNFESTDTTRVYKGDMHMVGTITNDPLFGKSRASMYFEMKPDGFPFYIPGNKDSVVVDSAVMILSYTGSYGDSMQPLRLTLSEISQSTPLDPLRAYPSNYPAVTPINISQNLASPLTVDIRRLGDSVKNRFENAKNQIRIKLSASQAKRFIKDFDSTNAYRSDSIFRTYFAGFALTSDAGAPANAFLRLSLTDTNSKFALYYSSSSTGATKRDTAVSYFKYSSLYSGDANFVTRDRSGSEAARHFTTTAKPDSLVYVQTDPGTYVRIRIPGLQNLSNRIIHRAELITEQVPDDANLLTSDAWMIAPRYLLLSVFDSVNKINRSVPNDYIMTTSGPNIASYGGYITTKAVPGYDQIVGYTFNLSRYVQGIVTRKDTSFTLRLSAPVNDSIQYKPPYPSVIPQQMIYLSPNVGNDVGDGRVRLGGGTHSRFRMRLRVVYSRI